MMIRRLIFFFALSLCLLPAAAQQGLRVASLFGSGSALAGRPDVTEVYLSGKQLKSYRLTLFRSLKVARPGDSDVALVESALKSDIRQAVDKQVVRRGKHIYYANCRLGDRKGRHRYLIYRNNGASSSSADRDIQLIYIEGYASAAELERMFEQ